MNATRLHLKVLQQATQTLHRLKTTQTGPAKQPKTESSRIPGGASMSHRRAW